MTTREIDAPGGDVPHRSLGDTDLQGDRGGDRGSEAVVRAAGRALAHRVSGRPDGDHQNPRRIPQRRGGAEITVSGVAASGEEMDHADSLLARSIEPLHDSVARSDTGPGEICTMTTPNASTSMGRGRDTLPLHPKNTTWPFTQKSRHTLPPGDRMSGLSALTIPLNLRPMPRLALSTDREC
jgi:hypothetical protein